MGNFHHAVHCKYKRSPAFEAQFLLNLFLTIMHLKVHRYSSSPKFVTSLALPTFWGAGAGGGGRSGLAGQPVCVCLCVCVLSSFQVPIPFWDPGGRLCQKNRYFFSRKTILSSYRNSNDDPKNMCCKINLLMHLWIYDKIKTNILVPLHLHTPPRRSNGGSGRGVCVLELFNS